MNLRSTLPLLSLLLGCVANIDAGSGRPDIGLGSDPLPVPLPEGIAPTEVLPDAVSAIDGTAPIEVAAGQELVFRVDTIPGEHTAFDLRFPIDTAGVLMSVERWDGVEAIPLGVTDGGDGIRVLAVLDQEGPRTFWVSISADEALSDATFTLTRTPFEDGNSCASDCASLLQLPIPNDPALDGYRIDGATFRYQFGRRDMIMFIRYAGQQAIAQGMEPFKAADISQWDGETPGTDRNAPRHASHQRGKDVDLSLYGEDGEAPFRSYCEAVSTGDGRECTPGSAQGYDGYANALMFGSFYSTGRVTRCFLDAELIPLSIEGAERAADDGLLDPSLLSFYADGVHLQHWPNHDNHIHVRISEE